MFIVKAALVTNHPQIGIRTQSYDLAPNLDSVAIQLGLLRGGVSIRKSDLRWIIHGNLLFVTCPDQRRLPLQPYHFVGCEDHQLSFYGPTFVFICPAKKQEQAERLNIGSSWAHIVESMTHNDVDLLQPLFSHGRGNLAPGPTSSPLTAVDGPRGSSGAGGGKPSGENPSHMEQMFEHLTGAGFDVHLVQDETGDVVALAAVGGAKPDKNWIERPLSEDPGFYSDVKPNPKHSVAIGITAEVYFDPIHFPGPASFVSSLLAGYMRCVALNLGDDFIEPEVATEMLELVVPYMQLVSAQRKLEPAMVELETPFMSKMPDEEGGYGR